MCNETDSHGLKEYALFKTQWTRNNLMDWKVDNYPSGGFK